MLHKDNFLFPLSSTELFDERRSVSVRHVMHVRTFLNYDFRYTNRDLTFPKQRIDNNLKYNLEPHNLKYN